MLSQQTPQPDPHLPANQQQAFNALFAELEAKLRKKASILCRREQSPSFNTGDLLGDLYLRLQKNPAYALAIATQGHFAFMAMAAQAMRRILTDAARKRKHKNSFAFMTLSHVDDCESVNYSPEDLICLDDALRALDRSHSRRAAIIQMRFYLGLSVSELQQCWGLSDATIENDIRSALKILHSILHPEK